MKRIYVGSDYYTISRHASKRMKSRNITISDIDFIIAHGLFERTEEDRIIYRFPDSPFATLGNKSRKRLNGAAVVLSLDGCIVIVFWKNDHYISLTGGMV